MGKLQAARLPQDTPPFIKTMGRRFCVWLRDREPTKERVREWLASLRDEGYAAGTVAYSFWAVRRVFIANDLPWPFTPKEGPVVSERDQWRPILSEPLVTRLVRVSATLRPEHQAHLAMSTTYGLRRAELMELGPHSFDLAGKTVYVATVKRGRQRYHTIPEALLPVLRQYDWPPRSGFHTSNIFTEIKDAAHLKGAQSSEVGYHAVRRSLTRILSQRGMGGTERRIFLRWKLSNMEDRYASGVLIGEEGETVALGMQDADLDALAFSMNPWLPVWEEVAGQPQNGAS